MRIFITGSTGLVGGHAADALFRRGHELRCLTRDVVAARHSSVGVDFVAGDFAEFTTAHSWLPLLKDIDLVINAAGIFAETESQRFEVVHTRAPCALFAACVEAGVTHVIQISALGADVQASSRFHLSKRTADDFLRQLPIRHTIIYPSLIFSPAGASTRLFAEVAGLPILCLPNRGRERVQPVHIDDVTDAIVGLAGSLSGPSSVPAVGREGISMAQYVNAFRVALGNKPRSAVAMPSALVRLGSRVMGVPLSADSLSMLERDNTASSHSIERVMGHPPRAAAQFFSREAITALQHHVEKRLWLPAMRGSIALVWIITAVISVFGYPVEQSLDLLARVGLNGEVAMASLYGAAAVDMALGVATLLMKRRRRLWQLQAALILGYTAIISIWLPEFWLHPYGPVLKNIPMLAMIGFLHRRETA